MIRLVIACLLLTVWGSTASRSHLPLTTPPPSCLTNGTWGNDWPLCGRVPVTTKSRGGLQQRLQEELKLTFKKDGTGELSFYDCQTQQRIPNPVTFTYQVIDDRLQFDWTGNDDKIRQSTLSFSSKKKFNVNCKRDTLFVDSLLRNTMYNGATYFVFRK
jgi:hypothetical protein